MSSADEYPERSSEICFVSAVKVPAIQRAKDDETSAPQIPAFGSGRCRCAGHLADRRSANLSDAANTTCAPFVAGSPAGSVVVTTMSDCIAGRIIVGAPAGFTRDASGRSKAALAASHQTMWREAAECFRRTHAASAAIPKTTVTPTICSTTNMFITAPLFWLYRLVRTIDRVPGPRACRLVRPATQLRPVPQTRRKMYRRRASVPIGGLVLLRWWG